MNDDKEQEMTFRQQIELANLIQKIRNEFDEAYPQLSNDQEIVLNLQVQLEEQRFIQTTEKTNDQKITVNPIALKAMLDYIQLLEEQLELFSFNALMEKRKGNDGFVGGRELGSIALDILGANQKEIRRFLDDDNI